MKLISFEVAGHTSYGIAENGVVREPGDELKAKYSDLRSLIGGNALSALAEDKTGNSNNIESVNLLPVIPNPDKIICVGVNYRPHIEEMGRKIPDYPVVFVRFPGSLVGHQQPIIRPQISEQYDFEGELAIVIGKKARHVSRQDAFTYIAGYCCFMDGSIRDWQSHTMQFTAGKNFDQSGAMGPWFVSRDEVPVPAALQLTTRVNGQVMQQGKLSDLLFDIPHLIEYCSTFTELLPGDVIATGTPGGVGAARKPQVWLKHGDTVEVDIPGVGLLKNTVADA
jgi:2-keto-4-pentenoate hydratase/2-oxohepta-3-ene-1,7-dioic acid hydratase in catechol pathway